VQPGNTGPSELEQYELVVPAQTYMVYDAVMVDATIKDLIQRLDGKIINFRNLAKAKTGQKETIMLKIHTHQVIKNILGSFTIFRRRIEHTTKPVVKKVKKPVFLRWWYKVLSFFRK
jgi:6-pyruvoyl-tetrahydropterin synthase